MAVQMNPAPGHLAGNGKVIANALILARQRGCSLVVFPELALMGYPIRDVITKHPALVEHNLHWVAELIRWSEGVHAAVGFVEPREPGQSGKPYFNSLALIGDGKLHGLVRKQLLPNYGEYEDWRTFEPPTLQDSEQWPTWCHRLDIPLAADQPTQQLSLVGTRIGFTICEDIWNVEGWPKRRLYDVDPVAQLKAQGVHLLINASASVARAGKPGGRADLLAHVARSIEAPVVYVNQVGAVDECCFDGQSGFWQANGTPTALAADDQAAVMVASLVKTSLPDIAAPAIILPTPQLTFSDQYNDEELARTYRMIVMGIRDYFAKTGFSRAVLGVSGGIDSAVTLVLLADALGAANVLGVTMPTDITPADNRSDAGRLIQSLGCPTLDLPIATIVSAQMASLQAAHAPLANHWGVPWSGSFSADNSQAMSRATLLRLLGNDYNALPIATSDKSEFYLGYTTVNGDMSGALAPLGDVVKTKVQALARWMNRHRTQPDGIPATIIDRPPGADLAVDPATGELLTAEAALMPYRFVDEIIWRIEREQADYTTLVQTVFEYEIAHGLLSVEQKTQWLAKFFRRMSASVFKWWLAPPVLLMDAAGSITKTDYHHPIVAGNIRWSGWTPATIATALAT